MRTVSYRLADLGRAVIPLGFVGENQHTRIIFDATRVFSDYPAAVPSLTVKPPQGASYPAVVVRDGEFVTWDVSDSDLIHAGTGELQLAFEENSVKVRTFIARTRIDRSIVPTGDIPEPLEDFLAEASAAVAAIPTEVADGVAAGFGAVTAEAETLEAGSSATAEFDGTTKKLTIGVPRGTDGQDGAPGDDGFSPVASVSKSGKVATISITDKTGTTTATVSDGTPVIDDTSTAADKVWSAQKVSGEVSDLNTAIGAKYTKPENGIPATDLASGVIPAVPVQDVTVDGVSVLSQGVAAIPKAATDVLGVVKPSPNDGFSISSGGAGYINAASDAQVKAGAQQYRPLVPYREHLAVFYGLAKAAGADEKDSPLSAGTYSITALSAIHDMLNAPVSVSGTTPSITGKSGIRYVCGEVATLTIVVPASGIIDVTFESGSTPTVLTVTPPTGVTIQYPAWFNPSSLAANTTYEINIADGKNAVVMAWA